MKKVLPILFVFLSLTYLYADDGGVRHPSEWTYGNIYVKDSNPAVSLENEFLYVNQYSKEVRAVFDFTNLTKSTVTVPCAFPAVIKIPYEYDGKKIFSNDFRVHYDPIALTLAFNKTENQLNTNPAEYDRTLRIFTIEDYEKIISNINTSDEYEVFKQVYTPVKLILNGKKIPVTHVAIETGVIQNDKPEEPEYGGTPSYKGEITLKLHFYHELEFVPGSSILEAEYFIDTRKGRKHGEYFNGFYDINTGGTWNGSIKNFVMICNGDVKIHNSKTTFDSKKLFNFNYYSYNSGTIVSAKNYKPAENEYFEFSSSIYDDEMSETYLESREPQSFVKDIKASSYLSGTFTSYDEQYDYTPESSFDGKVLNGWVEGIRGDGLGEWIQFTLTKTAFGPFMTNGLTRDYFNKNDDNKPNSFEEETEEKHFYWEKNNRIKKMTLENLNTKEKIFLELKDIYAGNSTYGEAEKTWIDVNANKNLSILFPGTYRLYIEDVYPGTNWDDTVLGEVWFYELGNAGEILFEEKFSKKNFFAKEIKSILVKMTDRSVRK